MKYDAFDAAPIVATDDGFFEEMQRREKALMGTATPEQVAIGWGDYFARLLLEMGQPLVIFGRVMPQDEVEAGERMAGAEDDEVEYVMAGIVGAHERGFRFGMHWSVVVPQGELGSTHCALLVPISEREYQAAHACDWRIDRLNARGEADLVRRILRPNP